MRRLHDIIVYKPLNFDPNIKQIFLTFDDGPVPIVTDWVLDLLKEHNAKATFFCIGDNSVKHQSIFLRILNEGHSVGNHTFNHLNGWLTSSQKYIDNALKCQQLHDFKLFRPPYGKITPLQYYKIKHQNLQPVLWHKISHDYNANLSPQKCFRNACHNARNGDILVFHDSYKAEKNLRALLPKVLSHFALNGYVFKEMV